MAINEFVENLKKLPDNKLLHAISKFQFLDGSKQKKDIQMVLEYIYSRNVVSIDFFIYFLNTNRIHLNDTKYLGDLIAKDFLKNNLIENALIFAQSDSLMQTLKLLKTHCIENYEISRKDFENSDYSRYVMISNFFNNDFKEVLDEKYEFLNYISFDIQGLKKLSEIIEKREEEFFEDKTLFLLFDLKRKLQEKLLFKISFSYCNFSVERLKEIFGVDSFNLMKKMILENRIDAQIKANVIHFN